MLIEIRTPEGHLLLLSVGIPSVPTLTVELREKWYSLFVVYPTGRVYPAEFPDEGEIKEMPFIDHVPNPKHVIAYAKKEGLAIDPIAFEVIVGRWEIEKGSWPDAP